MASRQCEDLPSSLDETRREVCLGDGLSGLSRSFIDDCSSGRSMPNVLQTLRPGKKASCEGGPGLSKGNQLRAKHVQRSAALRANGRQLSRASACALKLMQMQARWLSCRKLAEEEHLLSRFSWPEQPYSRRFDL